jgi:hypothetical protein
MLSCFALSRLSYINKKVPLKALLDVFYEKDIFPTIQVPQNIVQVLHSMVVHEQYEHKTKGFYAWEILLKKLLSIDLESMQKVPAFHYSLNITI